MHRFVCGSENVKRLRFRRQTLAFAGGWLKDSLLLREERLDLYSSRSKHDHFNGIAGNRFSVRVAGSMVMPTDSKAVTPKRGSTLSGPNMTRPAVTSPMKLIQRDQTHILPIDRWRARMQSCQPVECRLCATLRPAQA